MTELNYPNGFTIGIFLPKETSKEHVDRVMDCVSKLVYGKILEDRGYWDPMIVGRAEDVFQIDSGSEDVLHDYLSTSCFHRDHDYCKSETGLLGTKVPACCKFCRAPCRCVCHREAEPVDE